VWTDNTLGQQYDIFFRASHDNGKIFDDTVNLSNTKTNSIIPQILASQNYVYVLWLEEDTSGSRLIFISSNDYGKSFSKPIVLTTKLGSNFPESFDVAVTENNVSVAWIEHQDILHFSTVILRQSHDYGKTFDDPVDLLENQDIEWLNVGIPIRLGVFDDRVYATLTTFNSEGNGDVFFVRIDSKNVGLPLRLDEISDTNFLLNNLAVFEDNVYVLMQKQVVMDKFPFNRNDIYLSISHDGGKTFEKPVNITQDIKTNSRDFQSTDIIYSNEILYIALTEIGSETQSEKRFIKTHLYSYDNKKFEHLISEEGANDSLMKNHLGSDGENVYLIYQKDLPSKPLERPKQQVLVAIPSSAYLKTMIFDISTCLDCSPELAISQDGRINIVWTDYNDKIPRPNSDVYYIGDARNRSEIINLSAIIPKKTEFASFMNKEADYFTSNANLAPDLNKENIDNKSILDAENINKTNFQKKVSYESMIYPYGKGILKFEKNLVSLPCDTRIPNPIVKTVEPQQRDSILNIDDKYAHFFIILGNRNDDSYKYLQIELPNENGFPSYLLDFRKGDQRLRGEFYVDYDNLAIVLVTDKQANHVLEKIYQKYLSGDSVDVSTTTNTLVPGEYSFRAILFVSDNQNWPTMEKCAFFLSWPISVTNEGLALTGLPQTELGRISEITDSYSPLKQHRLGVNPFDIKCKSGLSIILQQVDESGNKRPACVTEATIQKLKQRGWTKEDITMIVTNDKNQNHIISYDVWTTQGQINVDIDRTTNTLLSLVPRNSLNKIEKDLIEMNQKKIIQAVLSNQEVAQQIDGKNYLIQQIRHYGVGCDTCLCPENGCALVGFTTEEFQSIGVTMTVILNPDTGEIFDIRTGQAWNH